MIFIVMLYKIFKAVLDLLIILHRYFIQQRSQNTRFHLRPCPLKLVFFLLVNYFWCFPILVENDWFQLDLIRSLRLDALCFIRCQIIEFFLCVESSILLVYFHYANSILHRHFCDSIHVVIHDVSKVNDAVSVVLFYRCFGCIFKINRLIRMRQFIGSLLELFQAFNKR